MTQHVTTGSELLGVLRVYPNLSLRGREAVSEGGSAAWTMLGHTLSLTSLLSWVASDMNKDAGKVTEYDLLYSLAQVEKSGPESELLAEQGYSGFFGIRAEWVDSSM